MLRRALPFAALASALVTAACQDAARELPTASAAEAATLSRTPRRALAGNVTIAAISIETRYWLGTSPLPDDLSAAATFAALPTNVPGYTYPAVSLPNLGSTPSVLLDPITGDQMVVSGVRHPGSASTNIATRIAISLTSNGPSSIGVRFGVDFLGGLVLLDGVPIASNWTDPSWYGYWLSDERANNAPDPLWVTNPWGVLEIVPLELSAGAHVIEIIGFEDGNDFGTGGQIDLGAGYQDIVGPVPPRNLTVAKTGGGVGSVASLPAGISCGADCAQAYDYGTTVTLTAAATPPSVFAGWSGACSGTSTSCTLTMDADRAVTAKFVAVPTVSAMTIETRYWLRSGPQPSAATAAALFAGLPTDREGYTNVPVRVASMVSNRALFSAPNVGADHDLATRTEFTLSTSSVTSLALRATVDYAAGGGIWLDGTLVTGTFGSAPGVLSATLNLSAGSHTITVLGFEDCCDGAPSLEFDYGTGWVQVTAPVPPPQTLTVTAGAAGGRVTSTPAGIDCGTSCSASFAAGSQVTLSVTVNPGYVFAGWSGGGCSGTGPTCVVRMNSAQFVTANLIKNTLTVTRTGTGGGTVVSSPAGINCGAICAADFAYGAVVTLTATPDGTSNLGAWSVPGCTGNTCTVTMQASRTVTISFVRRMHVLTVTKAGTGSGTVTSAPAGINCGTNCTTSFAEGSSVVLTAAPATGSVFTGWSGACAGTLPTCTVPMDVAKSATASFALQTFVLSVTKAGTGSGVVNAPSAGINCGSLCTATLNYGTTVTLTATASAGSYFAGWTGAGCSGTGTCTVTMSQARAVTATFQLGSADTTPPVISCKATPDVLWPANHKMVDIRVTVLLSDAGSGPGGFKLLSVTSNEPDNAPAASSDSRRRGDSDGRSGRDDDDDDDNGDGDTVNDIQGWLVGTPDVAGQLRAERAGGGSGRTYTLSYLGSDLAGNSATARCTVRVPHDMDDKKDKKDDKKDKDDRKP